MNTANTDKVEMRLHESELNGHQPESNLEPA